MTGHFEDIPLTTKKKTWEIPKFDPSPQPQASASQLPQGVESLGYVNTPSTGWALEME